MKRTAKAKARACAAPLLAAALLLVSCGHGGAGETTVTGDIPDVPDSQFADGDYKDVTSEIPNATITLSGGEGVISDTARGSSGTSVTVTSKGIYRVSGESDGVSIVIDEKNKSGNVYLVLDGVGMTCSSAPCILVTSCDKLVIQCVGENRLTRTASGGDYDGAVYSKSDVTVNGPGSLTIESPLHGLVGRDDVRITGGSTSIVSGSSGVKAGDSFRMGGGTLSVVSGKNGITVDGSDSSYVFFGSGSVSLTSDGDGIEVGSDGAAGTSYFCGGTLDITSGSGSSRSKSSVSQKGIKSDGSIVFLGTEAKVSSADDALHSSGDIYVSGGDLELSSSDDGIHADGSVMIFSGSVSVTGSYEGIEGYEVRISGGDVSVVSSDDGINSSGGSDTESSETRPSAWSGENGSASGSIYISGGEVYINAGGDGIDSNASLYVSGGTVIVEGPVSSGNGALDVGDGAGCVASVTGGVVLAVGSTGMAVNFSSGTQCSALVGISGSAGSVISVNDGSGFSFTATKQFGCVVYSSPSMSTGNVYTVTAGDSSATADFSSGLYYSSVGNSGPGGKR